MIKRVFANIAETPIRKSPRSNGKVAYYALLGQYLKVLEEDDEWCRVAPLNLGNRGWVHKDDVVEDPIFKMFIVDVGQGDGAFIESKQGLVIVDGGQYDNFYRYLKYRYGGILRNGKVNVKAMIISHPDADHYQGLKYIVDDDRFNIETIYHNGIVRYKSTIEGSLKKMTAEGGIKKLNGHATYRYKIANVKNNLNNLPDFVRNEKAGSGYKRFWESVEKARAAGRVGNVELLNIRDKVVTGFEDAANGNLRIEVLGPVPLQKMGRVQYPVFSEPPHFHSHSNKMSTFSHSHTRNGHSIVLKLIYGKHTFLLGGDLNIPAEQYLMNHYAPSNPFSMDVAKSCHHGSSDFSVAFLQQINAHATICSSGDNKSFDHPMPDSLGAAAKHGKGDIPLIFSTELGRAYNIRSAKKLEDVKTHYGLVNVRSNGQQLVIAQKKEQSKKKSDKWDSFVVPYLGKYKMK